MHVIEKNVIVAYSADKMYSLVANFKDYPQFLPWCSKADLLIDADNSTLATLHINYFGVKQSFSTRNINCPNERISMQLVDGPFRCLNGVWRFIQLGDIGCKIEFLLNYDFANQTLAQIVGPVFNVISDKMVDAFISEAGRRYDDNKKD